MLISQAALATLWLYSFLAGICFGGIWDALRIPRIWLGETGAFGDYTRLCARPLPYLPQRFQKKPSRILPAVRFLEDFLFCIAAGITMILLFYQINQGNIRIPALLCAAGGFFLYRATIGRIITRVLAFMAFFIETFVRYLIFLIGMPFRLLFRLFKRVAVRLWSQYRARREKRERQKQTRLAWRALANNACNMLPKTGKDVKSKEDSRGKREKKTV